jgi:hypothetical protein
MRADARATPRRASSSQYARSCSLRHPRPGGLASERAATRWLDWPHATGIQRVMRGIRLVSAAAVIVGALVVASPVRADDYQLQPGQWARLGDTRIFAGVVDASLVAGPFGWNGRPIPGGIFLAMDATTDALFTLPSGGLGNAPRAPTPLFTWPSTVVPSLPQLGQIRLPTQSIQLVPGKDRVRFPLSSGQEALGVANDPGPGKAFLRTLRFGPNARAVPDRAALDVSAKDALAWHVTPQGTPGEDLRGAQQPNIPTQALLREALLRRLDVTRLAKKLFDELGEEKRYAGTVLGPKLWLDVRKVVRKETMAISRDAAKILRSLAYADYAAAERSSLRVSRDAVLLKTATNRLLNVKCGSSCESQSRKVGASSKKVGASLKRLVVALRRL